MLARTQSSTPVARGQVCYPSCYCCFDDSSAIRPPIPSQHCHGYRWPPYHAFDCDDCHQCGMPYRTLSQRWLSAARQPLEYLTFPTFVGIGDACWSCFLPTYITIATHHLTARTQTRTSFNIICSRTLLLRASFLPFFFLLIFAMLSEDSEVLHWNHMKNLPYPYSY